MSDQPKPRRPLSEISHLFLSSIRQRQTGGASPPRRTPPGQGKDSVDLTPEELQVVAQPPGPRTPPVSAVIASHLNGKAFDHVKRYARSLAGSGQRVGLIEIDASEFRLMSFDLETGADAHAEPSEEFDLRAMSDAITEMSCDVDRWLLMVCSPRLPEARALLRMASHWVLLSTCDPDGVLCAYRSLKGLADLQHPRLSLAALEARTPDQAEQVLRKLQDVCGQFLSWAIEPDRIVREEPAVGEHGVMVCRPVKDKAQLAAAGHWQVVMDFLARANGLEPAAAESPAQPAPEPDSLDDVAFENCDVEESPEAMERPESLGAMEALGAPEAVELSEPTMSQSAFSPAAAPTPAAMPSPPPSPSAADDMPEVIDLPGAACDESAILAGVLQHASRDLAETVVRPPMCGDARLTVDRERRLVLLAVQKPCAASLRTIAAAFRWVNENRQLIAMALPQFAIDAHGLPRLRLLIDQTDANAELLQPVLQSGSVMVQTYRRLRWGGKVGLLLDAA